MANMAVALVRPSCEKYDHWKPDRMHHRRELGPASVTTLGCWNLVEKEDVTPNRQSPLFCLGILPWPVSRVLLRDSAAKRQTGRVATINQSICC
jgi:hypothetical protein